MSQRPEEGKSEELENLKMGIQYCEIINASGLYTVALKWQNSIIYTCYHNFQMQNFAWIYFFQTGTHYVVLASLDLTM